MDCDAPWTFVHVNDFQLGTPRSYRFNPNIHKRWEAIRKQIVALHSELMLGGGDLTRDGDAHEYEYQLVRDELDSLPFPSFVIPGNMDVGNRHADRQGAWENRHDPSLNMRPERLQFFASYFGPIHWTFVHRDVRFTGFYAAVAGSGLPEEERFWRLLEKLPQLPRARHHVAMMHYWPYMDRPDEPDWDMTDPDQYLNWYFTIEQPHRARLLDALQAANVDILLCGHVHLGRPEERVRAIRVVKTPSAGFAAQLTDRWEECEPRIGFQLCRVSPKGIDVEFIPGDDQRGNEGAWGPGGHPLPEARDYSVAREKPPLAPDSWLV